MKSSKLTKLLAVLAITALLAVSFSTALATGEYLGTQQVVNCSSWVTLRASASTSAKSVTHVPLGAWVETYYYNSQWCECWYNSQHGYILSTYLSNGSSGSSASSSADYLGKLTIVNCKEFVTLRAKPSTSADSITKVAKGQKVDAYYYNGTFCRCTYNGMTGYILSKYLSNGSGSSSSSANGLMVVVNCDNWVSLRSYASTKAPVVTTVPLGSTVTVYGSDGQFYRCRYKGFDGYILKKYLEYTDEESENYMGTMRIVNCSNWVSLRTYPSTSSSREITIPLGAYVDAYYYNSEFAEVVYKGYHGYVLMKYLAY